MFGGIVKAISGAFQAFNAWMHAEEIKEAKKDGARQTDLAQRDKQDEVRKEAKKFRRSDKPNTKRGAADRLSRNKGKGSH